MSKQISRMPVVIKKKLYSLIIMIAFLCIIAVPHSSTFAASNLEEGIKELAQQISNNMIKTGKKKIAVVEFSDLDGMITAFGQHLAEELITELFLASPGQFEVVERRQLMKVMSEQKLTMSGLLDAKAMESVGKILGIEAIVTGSMTDLESSIKINARMIGIETARVFAVARTSIPKIGIVAKLMAKEANISQSNIQTIPKTAVNLSPSSVYTNKNSKIFHKYNCSGLNAEGTIEFKSAQRAIKAGSIACKRCNPSQQVTGIGEKPFKNLGRVRVVLNSLQVMSDNSIILNLSFFNQTKKELLLAFDARITSRSLPENIYVIDEVGNRYTFKSCNNMGSAHFINIRRGKNGWLTSTPEVEASLSITFSPPKNYEERGSKFSTSIPTFVGKFYMDKYNYTRVGEETNHNISFTDISPK